jgi:hypothetical protein
VSRAGQQRYVGNKHCGTIPRGGANERVRSEFDDKNNLAIKAFLDFRIMAKVSPFCFQTLIKAGTL